MPEVAVILINYNSAGYTLECMASVLDKTAPEINFELVVVDNNSKEADFRHLSENWPADPRLKLVRSNINTGFGGGNMRGRQEVDARYLLFLNNDTQLLNDCLSLLAAYMDQHPEVGVCTAQNYDQHGNFVPSFDHDKGLRKLIFGRGMLQKTNSNRYPERKKEYSQPLSVDWVNGAFMFFRASDFDTIGGFDPNIFLYFEEMDLSKRLRKMGKESVLYPQAKILHHQGVSIGRSKEIDKEAYISYLYVIRKNRGQLYGVLVNIYLILVCLIKPKKWYLLPTLLSGGSRTRSLKNKQLARNTDASRN